MTATTKDCTLTPEQKLEARRAQKKATAVAYRARPEVKAKEAEHVGGHVDHIIPLTHPKVSGLHVIFNLQLLDADENIRNGNRFDPESYVHELPEAA